VTTSDNDCDERVTSSTLAQVPSSIPYSVVASAPVRTADAGGWTDTWFAGRGVVCNVAIEHRVHVRVDVDPSVCASIELDVQMTGERYRFAAAEAPGRHPMLEAAASAMAPDCSVVVTVGDTIEGSGLGTSSAVLVAAVGALTVAAGGVIRPDAVAAAAHRFETADGRQAGVQDHIAAAYGGISLIEIDYPNARRQAVVADPVMRAELDRRLITVWFGRSRESSSMHEEVIARIRSHGASSALDGLRDAARQAADALARSDLTAYAAALTRNHAGLDALHPELVSDEARELIELGRRFGAVGWKSNGAGGPGGSMVLVGPSDPLACARLRDAIAERAPWRCIHATIAERGVVAERRSFHDSSPGGVT
jgi:D-glycero-alpha-D-manno-heptose-7-phosphate kinase